MADPHASHTAGLPTSCHQQPEWDESTAVWHDGYTCALRDIAAGHVELDTAWRRVGQPRHEQRVAERLALFEQCAARLAARLGRPPGYTYPGGPVPWDTTAQPRPALREVA